MIKRLRLVRHSICNFLNLLNNYILYAFEQDHVSRDGIVSWSFSNGLFFVAKNFSFHFHFHFIVCQERYTEINIHLNEKRETNS